MNDNHQQSGLSEILMDNIAQKLQQDGLILIEDFLPLGLAMQLMQEAHTLALTDFKPAAVGRRHDLQVNSKIRSDSTLWLQPSSPVQSNYLQLMEELRVGLNRRLFLGLFDFQSHFSVYRQGDYYRRHMDAFKGLSNRVISTVCYLNRDWQKEHGGELLLYADEQKSPQLIVPPVFNQCVIFLSDTFPHEVLATRSDRYSIAGWYSTNDKQGH
jgi:SM-20-related protein